MLNNTGAFSGDLMRFFARWNEQYYIDDEKSMRRENCQIAESTSRIQQLMIKDYDYKQLGRIMAMTSTDFTKRMGV